VLGDSGVVFFFFFFFFFFFSFFSFFFLISLSLLFTASKTFAHSQVLVVPGAEFMPDPSLPSPFVRASFSTASTSDVHEALRRLANALRSLK
jgi:DNA-binding transcriptional MocR family regulator